MQSQVEFRQVSARLLRISDATQFGLALTALVVGLISVTTTLSMVAHEPRGELAVLRALGLRPGTAALALLLDSVLLTLTGGLVGSVAGGLLAQGLNTVTNEVLGVGAGGCAYHHDSAGAVRGRHRGPACRLGRIRAGLRSG